MQASGRFAGELPRPCRLWRQRGIARRPVHQQHRRGIRNRTDRADERQLPARHPDLRSAAGPVPVQRPVEADPARTNVCVLQERLTRAGDRFGRYVHAREPDSRTR